MTDKKDKTFKSDEKKYHFGLSQKAVIYDSQENKYLLLKSKDGYFAEKYGPWDLAGGTMNPGENFKEAMEREIKEEVGDIDYEILDVIASEKIFNSDGGEKIYLGNFVKYIGKEIQISEEHTEYKWESYKNIIESKETKPWLKNFIEKAQKYLENQKNLDGWKRCQADFENYKKRQAETQKDFIRFSTESVILQLLPVLDNFHASTDHVPKEQKDAPWVVGIMHIQKQLESVLTTYRVTEIETKGGDEFNPEFHEAVANGQETGGKEQKTESKEQKNKIIKVVQRGYKIDNKVIRAARVIVE